jgi:hypothetical protein
VVNIAIKWVLAAQRGFFVRQYAIQRCDEGANNAKEFGVRSLIPSAVTDGDEYWHDVAEKCLRPSGEIGAPTFFDDYEESLSAKLPESETGNGTII